MIITLSQQLLTQRDDRDIKFVIDEAANTPIDRSQYVNETQSEQARFRHFDEKEDDTIRSMLACGSSHSDLITAANDIGACQKRAGSVIIQRSFQLGLIAYSPFAHHLLSHRRNGWRSDEVDYLIKYRHYSKAFLARELNRSEQSIAKQMHEFRLNGDGKQYIWTEDDEKQLQVAKHKTLKELKSMLKRSAIDIKHKMVDLKITHRGIFTPFTGRPRSF
jgi:hypothetical protein